jgi:hypothetical protein
MKRHDKKNRDFARTLNKSGLTKDTEKKRVHKEHKVIAYRKQENKKDNRN